ncbi:hypothetical protein [Streptacidiphilus albus]|jgi:hypothetical protein|uniref:hypothetical protein n=1 Tax=Streptacidiphilus albus TaxID=105425 RepID=UPI00054BB1C7|nr:hypothetical protein [Streptacidiphilus albus]
MIAAKLRTVVLSLAVGTVLLGAGACLTSTPHSDVQQSQAAAVATATATAQPTDGGTVAPGDMGWQ